MRNGFLLLTASLLPIFGFADCSTSAPAPERAFLQKVGAESAVVRWRGGRSVLCAGETADDLSRIFEAELIDGHRSVRIDGLAPDRQYFYEVGDQVRSFRTAPDAGTLPSDGRVHVWIIGDSGTAGERNSEGELEHEGEAAAVRDGFRRYNAEQGAGEPVDLFLLLGDSAYPAGLDEQWQESFFDVYPDLAASAMTVPTIGNHEMGYGLIDLCQLRSLLPPRATAACEKGPLFRPLGGASSASDPMTYDEDGDGVPSGAGPPYLKIFDLPADGEIGGVASGTELYYSLDYGPLHVISLDSQLSNGNSEKRAVMAAWLKRDLEANALPWTVVIFHHPPYSKGANHDSDTEQREIDMRTNFGPLLERHGVDVVYSGHAHSYERSWSLQGHVGASGTFSAERHALLAEGEPAFGGVERPYPQAQRTVYTVAGNSGHVTSVDGRPPCEGNNRIGCRFEDWLEHPAHRTFDTSLDDHAPNGIARIGSVVLDVTARTLRSRFVDDSGQVLDEFVIERAPSISAFEAPGSPSSGARLD